MAKGTSMSSYKAMKQFVREYVRLGFNVIKTRRNHWRFTHPDMAYPVFGPSTPSDYRAIKNLEAEIRRSMGSSELT